MPPISYHSGPFPPRSLDWLRLVPLIGPAASAVARYEGALVSIPNAAVLLAPLTTQEAVLSSRIEGTQATFGEVLEFEAGGARDVSPERRADIQEVLNYRSALRHAVARMADLPLSQRLLRETHSVLMEGVRGQNKAPGEFRRVANWIGPPGSTSEHASFVPPGPEQVPALMSAWERYLHSQAPDLLVQLALLHAELEAIHPFLDGNGRLGRLLVPLFMVEKGLLSSPSFYVSDYLEAHRTEYYERLLAVSRDADWTGWCAFFLTAIAAQAHSNLAKATEILDLYQDRKNWISDLTRSHNAIRALDWFFTRPIFSSSEFVASVGVPRATALRILRLVRNAGMLVELRPGKGSQPSVLAFRELLRISEGRSPPL